MRVGNGQAVGNVTHQRQRVSLSGGQVLNEEPLPILQQTQPKRGATDFEIRDSGYGGIDGSVDSPQSRILVIGILPNHPLLNLNILLGSEPIEKAAEGSLA